VNLGTRFLASDESPIGDVWKKAIVGAAASEAWVQLDFLNDVSPNPGTVGYGTRVRALRTEFTDRWQERRQEAQADPGVVIDELTTAAGAGRIEELLVVGGQSAGIVRELLPVAEIVRALVDEAEAALARVSGCVT
jgi:enoyl-[acyl-carrier protein] reductase II